MARTLQFTIFLVLAVSEIAHLVECSGSGVQTALEQLFGSASNPAAQAEVMAMLDIAIDIPGLKTSGEQYRFPELDEPGAVEFTKRLLALASSASDCSPEWIAAVRSFFTTHVTNITNAKVPDVFGKRQAFPALRRMVLAQLVKAWLTRMNKQLPTHLEDGLQSMILEVSVRLGFTLRISQTPNPKPLKASSTCTPA
jgi:hypothetical protein